MEGYHSSVLLREVVDALEVKEDSWYLDCTLGDGGHSLEILKRGGRVLGLDVDPQAIERATKRLQGAPEGEGYSEQDFVLLQGNFRDIDSLIQSQQRDTDGLEFAGAIFDLGVSSLQLENPERGFSFVKNGPLDMRMDPSLQIKALDLVNNLSGKELYEVFKNLGEEKYSKRLAAALVCARAIKPFATTSQLAEAVVKEVGGRERIHPATRIFQALRIVVNDELSALKDGLEQVRTIVYGVICVISFHSLEDRITKLSFRDWERQNLGEIVTKKPILPSLEEISCNPRARSGKLRVFRTNDNYKKI